MLHILIIGAGGREHALAWRLAASASVQAVIVMPGNSGTERLKPKVSNVPTIDMAAREEVTSFFKEYGINLVIPTRETDLINGIADQMLSMGVPCFGPTAMAARLEASKHFAKMFMSRHGIPTPACQHFWTFETAVEYLVERPPSGFVIKASGITSGKGVIIAHTLIEALKALLLLFKEEAFGTIADCGPVLVEEYVTGPEFSVMAITDGLATKMFPPFRDYKRRFDGDVGPNTGSMGCQVPVQECPAYLLGQIQQNVFERTISGMRREGYPYCGLLCVDIIVTDHGPMVLEFDARPGDPETQALLPLLEPSTDLGLVMFACTQSRLRDHSFGFQALHSTSVVLATASYPSAISTRTIIKLSESSKETEYPTDTHMAQIDRQGSVVFHGRMWEDGDLLVTTGGRVAVCSGWGRDSDESRANAYQSINLIDFEGKSWRRDIGI